MHILSPEAVAAAENRRFLSAGEDFARYELQRQGVSNVFRVLGGTVPYVTTETHCSCPDHQHRGLACKHIQLVRARILADGTVLQAERSTRAQADRALWG